MKENAMQKRRLRFSSSLCHEACWVTFTLSLITSQGYYEDEVVDEKTMHISLNTCKEGGEVKTYKIK